jgi:hypothetical protein
MTGIDTGLKEKVSTFGQFIAEKMDMVRLYTMVGGATTYFANGKTPAAANPSRPMNTAPSKKMNVNHYFSTLTALFTDSTTRNEFTSYLKTLFGSKTTKNS